MNTTTTLSRKDAAAFLATLRGFIGFSQLAAIGEICYSEEKQSMFVKLAELAGIVDAMPKTYETDGQGKDAIAQLHYFTSGFDWYITEKDMMPEQLQAFGMADLGHGGELGYISIVELLQHGAELDLYWTPCKLSEI